jgi:plasmid maintenance system antidote protein VapI
MYLRDRDLFVQLLDELGISERELARRAQLGHGTVNHLVTGRRQSCSLETATAIERALNCSPNVLFAERVSYDN